MKSVGIMTWYRYHNYGTALQAAALFHEIALLGYEPSLIQYPPRKAVQAQPAVDMHSSVQKLRQKVLEARHRPYNSEERKTLFSSFLKKNIRSTKPCLTYPELYELNSVFDAFVCGSDQIWAPGCFDEKYFLSFVSNASKMVAYAPSIGLASIADGSVRDRMKTLIARFEHLSIRESQGAELIASLCGKNAEVVLDPTLLLSREEWDALLGQTEISSPPEKGKYILCYFLGDYRRYANTVRTISKALNLPVSVIPVFQEQKSRPNAVPFEVGPAEFVRLIQNAAYVCTDSFHGLAFAMNFNIPFTVFRRFSDRDPRSQNSRVYSLLKRTGMQQRLENAARASTVSQARECDFTQPNRVLDRERKKSLAYLRNALSSAVGAQEKKEAQGEFRITELCCGCGACAAVCPVNAVSIRMDEQGFEHYVIDAERCIRCGRCRQVCPFRHVSAAPLADAGKLYSFQSSHAEVLKKSSSGGVAHEIAEIANSSGAWVCGSAYLPKKDGAEHLLLPPESEGLSLFQGSKYLQSSSADALARIASFQGEEKLAFFGTPCQTAGVDKILRLTNRRDSAVLVDLICHGVPTRLLWNKYLKSIESSQKIPAHPAVSFRSSEGGWRNRKIEVSNADYTYLKSEKKDDFYAFFRHSLCFMRACYDCPYREKSAADLRIGDFWGPRFAKDSDGVSMVIAVTGRGKHMIRRLTEEERGTVTQEQLKEYWTVQYPENPPFPLFYDDLLVRLKEDGLPLAQIREQFAASFERYEIFFRMKQSLKNTIRGQKG